MQSDVNRFCGDVVLVYNGIYGIHQILKVIEEKEYLEKYSK